MAVRNPAGMKCCGKARATMKKAAFDKAKKAADAASKGGAGKKAAPRKAAPKKASGKSAKPCKLCSKKAAK